MKKIYISSGQYPVITAGGLFKKYVRPVGFVGKIFQMLDVRSAGTIRGKNNNYTLRPNNKNGNKSLNK